jgi:hypothetical protein
MSELFAEGDLVEATKDEQVIRNRIKKGRRHSNLYMVVGDMPNDLLHMTENLGFTLTLLEKATPPLPTEPGIYVSWVGLPSPTIVHKLFTGFWVDAGDNNYLEDSDVSALMPLTRLEPVAETAKKVLDRVLEEYGTLPLRFIADVLPIVAEEFGVTS